MQLHKTKKSMHQCAVYNGSSNPTLGNEVAKKLGCSVARVEISKFSNDETRVWVNESKIPPVAIIVQSLSQPTDQHIVEFCLLADAVHRLGAREIIAVVPWLGYSKQDKVFRPGEPLSVKVVAKILQTVPVKQLITFDLHNLAILGFFDIPVTNLAGRGLFEEYLKTKVTPKTVVVAPDAGSIKASTAFAERLGLSVIYIDKKRNLQTGKVTIVGMSGTIEDGEAIIVDDLIVTGSTIVETAKYLRQRGIKTITVAATHHAFVSGAQGAIEAAGVDWVVVTDTICAPPNAGKKLISLSVSSMIADEIRRSL